MAIKFSRWRLCLLFSLSLNTSAFAGAATEQTAAAAPLQIAFLPDVHFHDVYGQFPDAAFIGPQLQNKTTPDQTQPVTIRTMAAQLHSTRLFNENYFAFIAALDDLARRQVKLVVLPGDFSDDGQPVHIRGLKQVLQRYQREHGMRFFLTFGNHDPVRPFSQPGGKADFMASDGKPIGVYSRGTAACPLTATQAKGVVCTEAVRELGYQELLAELGEFGLMPANTDLHWETPFSRQQQLQGRAMPTAVAATLANRQAEICANSPGGRYKAADATDCRMLPDVSYLTEPVPGLWLLALDANVYLPNPQGEPQQASGYRGSGNAGYDAVIRYKPYLLEWVKDVAARAKKQHKTLISFSHFPMAEFYQGQGPAIARLLGAGQGQLSRLPAEDTSQILAGLGLTLHIGGHMHLNNTAIIRGQIGQQLVNVQAPSIAAYRPAYKLLSQTGPAKVRMQTVLLDEVPGFGRFFPLYQREWQQLKRSGAKDLWDMNILQAKNYHQYANWHLTELTRQRFLPQDWPAELRLLLLKLNGQQMLLLSQTAQQFVLADLLTQPDLLSGLQQSQAWQQASRRLQTQAQQAGITWSELAGWDGLALATDFYRLQTAGALAFSDISLQRRLQYQFFARTLHGADPQQCGNPVVPAVKIGQLPLQSYAAQNFCQLFSIISHLLRQARYDDFSLDLRTGTIESLSAH